MTNSQKNILRTKGWYKSLQGHYVKIKTIGDRKIEIFLPESVLLKLNGRALKMYLDGAFLKAN